MSSADPTMGSEGAGLLIVTGGGSGIGAAIARQAAREGWAVLNLSRSGMREPLSLEERARIESVQVDLVRDWRRSALAFTQTTLKRHTRLARRIALVHNAAFSFNDTAQAPRTAEMSALLELSTLIPARLNELVIPRMQRGSSIIYIGSTLSHKGVSGSLSYTTAKHALLGLARATAKDLYGTGIHALCVCPGPTETPMLSGLYGEGRHPMFEPLMSEGRLATPEEIARVVLFAAASPQMNGALIDAAFGEHL